MYVLAYAFLNHLSAQIFFHKNYIHRVFRLYVFAYGSNLHAARMRARVSTASPVTIGYVAGRQLRFQKRSVDGSAKADAAFTADPSHRTWGVIFQIAMEHKSVLDDFEFVCIGYDSVKVRIALAGGGHIPAWTYRARSAAIEKGLKPYTWYKAFMVHGARQHGLPAEYVEHLEQIEAAADADPVRHQLNTRIIEGWQRRSA